MSQFWLNFEYMVFPWALPPSHVSIDTAFGNVTLLAERPQLCMADPFQSVAMERGCGGEVEGRHVPCAGDARERSPSRSASEEQNQVLATTVKQINVMVNFPDRARTRKPRSL